MVVRSIAKLAVIAVTLTAAIAAAVNASATVPLGSVSPCLGAAGAHMLYATGTFPTGDQITFDFTYTAATAARELPQGPSAGSVPEPGVAPGLAGPRYTLFDGSWTVDVWWTIPAGSSGPTAAEETAVAGCIASTGTTTTTPPAIATTTTNPKPPPRSSASTGVIGTARSSGYGAMAEATVTAPHPNELSVHVTASPRQTVTVHWSTMCARGFSATGVSGTFRARAPLTRKIAIAQPGALACIVVADSQLTGAGSIVMQLLAS